MSTFESPVAALDFEKSWAELTDRQRQLIRQLNPSLAEPPCNGLPASTNTAIVGNAATAAQGIWQYYATDRETWIDIPVDLSDTNALVLPASVALRFHRAPNWSENPGALTARISYGDLPSPDVRDISGSVGITGQWTAGTMTIDLDANGKLAFSYALWDFLATGAADLAERRRDMARQSDVQNDPAFEEDQEPAFRLVAKASELENYIAELERRIPTSIEEMVVKRTELEERRRELKLVEGDLEKACAAGRPHHHQPRGARVSRRPPQSSKPSQAVLEEWYQEYVAAHDPAQPPPSRDDDAKAAREQFKVGGLKDMVRLARRTHAPEPWKQSGAKGRKLRQHASSRSKAK